MKFQKFFHFNNKIFAIGAILQIKQRRKFGILTMGGGYPYKNPWRKPPIERLFQGVRGC